MRPFTLFVPLLHHAVLGLLIWDAFHHDVTCRYASTSPKRRLLGRAGTSDEYRCGDDLCWCYDDDSVADCAEQYVDLPYIPRLQHFTTLLFSDNRVSSQRLNDPSFFSNATNIIELDLGRNNIESISKAAFRLIRNLTSLSLDGNRGLTFDAVRNVLSISTLRHLDATFCALGTPPPDAFSGVEFSRLETLGLSDNNIKGTLNITIFLPFRHLKELSLENNYVETLLLDSTWTDGADLEFSATSENSSVFPELEFFNLKKNRLATFGPDATHNAYHLYFPKLISLDISENPLELLFASAFSDQSFPRLTNLFINNVPSLRFAISRSCAFRNRHLEKLSLAKCYLDFSSPLYTFFETFANCPQLTTLILNYNDFSAVSDTLFLQLFGNLRSLKTLFIETSKLDQLSSGMFANFPNLSRLYLRGNGIRSLPDGTFDVLPNLQYLDISGNRISTVSEKTFSKDTRKGLSKLLLGNNPFVCSCDLMWFKAWLASNHSLFYSSSYRRHKYNCSNIPETGVTEFSIELQACLLTREMSVQIIFSCSSLIFTLTLVSLLFRYRWHIRLMIYETFRGRDDVRRRHLEAGNFDYDVFVSYDSADLFWVREHLMPELEDRLGLRLCVHERDFIPGNNIVDNITDCVYKSKKIMVIFSKSFVKSQWCQFELNFCLQYVLDYEDALIIVCLDDVASRDMTSAMMAVLKTTTYIQWEEAGDAVAAFWGRLRLSLHETIQQQAVL